MIAYACVVHGSELNVRERFNRSAADRYIVVEEVVALGALVLVGGIVVGAWRNYWKSVFKKGFVYKLSASPHLRSSLWPGKRTGPTRERP